MKIFRRIAASFSMFSKIPMPRFRWDEGDGAYTLMFFPLVGLVTGALTCCLNMPVSAEYIPVAVRILLTLALPLMVTGGIHIDGFMDTEDAFASCSDKDRKLEILKDPHTGAFAVISLIRAGLVYAAAVSAILLNPRTDMDMILIFALVSVLSRCCSGLTSVFFTKARTTGMLSDMTRDVKRPVVAGLIVQFAAAAGVMICVNALCTAAVLLAAAVFTLIYRQKAYKEFGGVTGDTAGWYLSLLEIVCAVVIGGMSYVA